MGDRAYAQITFGGRLPSRLLPELRELIQSTPDYEGADDNGLDEHGEPTSKAPVTLAYNESNGGRIPDVEGFCRAHGLPYVIRNDPGDAYGASVGWFVPGVHDPENEDDLDAVECPGGRDGGSYVPHVPVHQVRDLIAATPAEDRIEALLNYLDAHTPPEVPPLVVVPQIGDRVRVTFPKLVDDDGPAVIREGTVIAVQDGPADEARFAVRGDDDGYTQARLFELTWLSTPEPAATA